ncbi:MAG: hypothetical protein FWB91_07055 [Defluviitaleaceae bacterium]|nr:hypothetical protein [Defluviitaleaceae bacterium]
MLRKSSRGGAYIMTLTVAMLLIALVLSVLTITVNSRRITARYGYFFGLYDLAIAGNEQAFFRMQQSLQNYSIAAHSRAQSRTLTLIQQNPNAHLARHDSRYYLYPPDFYMELFIAEIMPDLRRELHLHRHSWGLELDFNIHGSPDNIQDRFQAVTTIENNGGGFYIRTRIYRLEGVRPRPGSVAVVQSQVRWRLPSARNEEFLDGQILINCLDYYVFEMVELFRVAD